MAVHRLNESYPSQTPTVEDIQDVVVETLKNTGYTHIALEYQNYREKKAEIRALRKELGILDEPKLSVNAVEVLEKRYRPKRVFLLISEGTLGDCWTV